MTPEACPWRGFDPPTIAFCERRICAWVVEPSNAWSNVAYVLVGIAILIANRRGARDAVGAMGLIAILVGVGSFAFHATGTFIGEAIDVSSMYLISGTALAFALRRTLSWSDGRSARFFLALFASSVVLLVVTRHSGIPVFAIQLMVAVALEVRLFRGRAAGTSYSRLAMTIGCFGVAFGIWLLDISEILCDPDNHLVTGHAVWHGLTALSLWFYFDFQRSQAHALNRPRGKAWP